jgi:hypothetical protein
MILLILDRMDVMIRDYAVLQATLFLVHCNTSLAISRKGKGSVGTLIFPLTMSLMNSSMLPQFRRSSEH